MKITVEIDLDQASYDKQYGPGSEFWQKYYQDKDPAEYDDLTMEETMNLQAAAHVRAHQIAADAIRDQFRTGTKGSR